MTLQSQPVTKDEQLAYLIELNRQHSQEFCSPDARNARSLHRAKHPTEIVMLKCMDGRVHGPDATKTPLGILQPFRNLGGRFNMGWPHFQAVLADWKNYSIRRGRHCLILVTYHFSAGDPHRGCAGFGYDTEAAIAFTKKLTHDISRVFGESHEVVHPILVGFETDEDAFVLHGENGEVVHLSKQSEMSDDDIIAMLQRLYPTMHTRILHDFVPLVSGNFAHIKEVRESQRPIINMEHREWILALGRGFDWLHSPNTALIVGPWSHNLEVPVLTAAKIIRGNMEAGRIASTNAVLLTSAIYRDPAGDQPLLAIEKTKFLSEMAMEVITREYPDLAKVLTPLPVTVDMNTRKMNIIQ